MAEVEQHKPIIITATMLSWFNMCHRHVWLDRFGDRSERDEITSILAYPLKQGVKHEREVHIATAPNAIPFSPTDWADGVRLTREFMAQGTTAIMGAYLELRMQFEDVEAPVILRGKVDRLARYSEPAIANNGKQKWIYAPIEIKSYSSISDKDLIQLDAYTFLLGWTQGIFTSGEFWLGRATGGRPKERLPHTYDKDRLIKALSETVKLLSSVVNEPKVTLKSICHKCEWQSACHNIAENQLDVSLLPKLTDQIREQFQREGITSLNQIAAMSPDELRRFKGIKTTAEGIRAHAQALITKSPIWYRALPNHMLQGGWFFDIETIMPENKEVWSIGWGNLDGIVKVIVVNPNLILTDDESYSTLYFSNGQAVYIVQNADMAWRVFANAVDDTSPIFHWSQFDGGVMKNHAPEDVKDKLMGRLFDLCYIFDRSVKLPIRSLSLKTVAPYVSPEFDWDEQGDALIAHINYRKWIEKANLEALKNACKYQNDDVQALKIVWEWLVNHQPQI